MYRADLGLPFMLQYENIAWYDEGEVRILNRLVYPASISFVSCRRHEEVTKAIADMITQSAGPFTAAGMGMALAAHECRELDEDAQKKYLADAAYNISHARPTTVKRMQSITSACLEAAVKAIDEGRDDIDIAVRDKTIELNNDRYDKIAKIGEHLVKKIPDGGAVMTQCFAETILGIMCRELTRQNKTVRFYCPETRPYFQGSRLAATVCSQAGFYTTVITDNMPAAVMANEHIDVFTCAADIICCDGYVVNKVGTNQIAICARHYGIPMYVTGCPDLGHPTHESITIEMRDPERVLQAMGVRTAAEGVHGYYPAFDITAPEFITGVVTDEGIYRPDDLNSYITLTGGKYGTTV